MTLYLAGAVVIAYLLGGIPFGYLFVRLAFGKDIRSMGSGNIGATNVHRSAGGKAGVAVLLLDMTKGFFAVWIAALLNPGSPLALSLAAVAVMIGHAFPVFLRFKGGKAVACFIGAFLHCAARDCGSAAHLRAGGSRHEIHFARLHYRGAAVSARRLADSASAFAYRLGISFSGLFIVYRHKANIQRLSGGTENVFSLKGRRR